MIFKLFVQILLIISLANHVLAQQYYMSRAELESYLSRAITMQEWADENDISNVKKYQWYQDDLRMIANIKPKFLSRVANNDWNLWGNENHYNRALKTAEDVHAIDPSIILQAAFFEFVPNYLKSTNLQIQIPNWVFQEFPISNNDPVYSNWNTTAYYFDFTRMAYDDYETNCRHAWYYEGECGSSAMSGIVPDISKRETKMWFYYKARRYIDAGYEAIHQGWMAIQDENDPTHTHRWELCSRIRNYAANYARRHFVLLDGHGQYYLNNDGQTLMFDFHGGPLPFEEATARTPESGGGESTFSAEWAIQCGQDPPTLGHSIGGITYMGWTCNHLPSLFEFDSGAVGEPGSNTRDCSNWWLNWGWDGITWFAVQSEEKRKDWLTYAWYLIKCVDQNAFLMVPGYRTIRLSPTDLWPEARYHANHPSNILPAPPTNINGYGYPAMLCSQDNNGDGLCDIDRDYGFNLEETIKRLWDSGIPSGNAYSNAYKGENLDIWDYLVRMNTFDGYYEFAAKNQIRSDAMVNSPSVITFVAGNTIELLPGFEANMGTGGFEAKIDKSLIYCDNAFSGKKSQEDIESRSVNTREKLSLKLYPNPTSNNITLETPSLSENQTAIFSMYDLLGKLILTNIFTDKQNMKEINITELRSGIYFFRFQNGEINEQGKLVITK